MKTKLVLSSLAYVMALGFPVWADTSTVSSTPQGYVKLEVAGRTDTLVTAPLLQPASAIGVISGVGSNTLILDGAGLTMGQYTPTTGTDGRIYYLEFTSGALEGVRYKILGNTEDTLTLETGTETLAGHPLGSVVAGDVVRIRSCWTVGQIFGASDDSLSLTAFSQFPTASQADTADSLLFSDNETPGVTKIPSLRLVYLQANGWRTLGDTATDYSMEPLPPGRVVRVRRFAEDPVELYVLGLASSLRSVVRLPAGDSTHGNDIVFGLVAATPVPLSQSALFSASSSVLRVSPDVTQREDELLVYGMRKGFDRPPERSFFYLDGQGWREVGNASTTIGDEFQLEPGKGYLLRKRTPDQLLYWVTDPGY